MPDRAYVYCRVVEGETGVAGFVQQIADHYHRLDTVAMTPVGAKPVGRIQGRNGPGKAIFLYSVLVVAYGQITVEPPQLAAPDAPPEAADAPNV